MSDSSLDSSSQCQEGTRGGEGREKRGGGGMGLDFNVCIFYDFLRMSIAIYYFVSFYLLSFITLNHFSMAAFV